MSRGAAIAAVVIALPSLWLGACGEGDAEVERPGARGALGGTAGVRTLARVRLDSTPRRELAWVAHELKLRPGRTVEHDHEPAFTYARRGASLLTSRSGRQRIRAGAGRFVPAGARHRHSAPAGSATVWEIRLADPAAPPPPAAGDARRVFVSAPLAGIPPRPIASFLLVELPPRGGRTTVHSHPGPEFIYQLEGEIDYQNVLVGTKRLAPGGAEAIPPGTAVQKRNPSDRKASFLSWFLVDPDRPFAPRARF